MPHPKPPVSKQAGSFTPATDATAPDLMDAEAEVAILSHLEAELAAAECLSGCDYPDGPLAAQGCPW